MGTLLVTFPLIGISCVFWETLRTVRGASGWETPRDGSIRSIDFNGPLNGSTV